MHWSLMKCSWLGIVALVTALGMATSALAEKREESYVKKNFRTANKTVVPVGEGRELIQELGIADIKFANPDFKVKDEWVYEHSDLVHGSGSGKGYYIDTHEDGSQTYGTFEGTKKLSTKSDGAWELIWEGTYKYIGGTGRFNNIKGNGKYKGSASTSDPGGTEHGSGIVEY